MIFDQGSVMTDRHSLARSKPRAFGFVALAAVTVALSCSPDGPTPSAPTRESIQPRHVFSDAPSLVHDALAGRGRRGEQDEMLRLEAQLPGFGGFFIDSLGEVVVYMRSSDGFTPANV